MNFNLPRWIRASTNWHFQGHNTVLGEYLFYDPHVVPDTDPAISNWGSWGVLRIDGPHETQESTKDYTYIINLSLLVNTRKKLDDIYFHDQKVGNYCFLFTECIVVFRIGDGPYDTHEIIDAMHRMDEAQGGHGVQVHNFGQLDKTVDLIQSTIECSYRMVCSGPIE